MCFSLKLFTLYTSSVLLDLSLCHCFFGNLYQHSSSNPVPTVTFTSPNYEVLENNGTATVCVRKDLEVVGSFDVDITSREIVPRQAEGMHSASVH